jgi:hypothetical protein
MHFKLLSGNKEELTRVHIGPNCAWATRLTSDKVDHVCGKLGLVFLMANTMKAAAGCAQIPDDDLRLGLSTPQLGTTKSNEIRSSLFHS